jgi:preprotein translocase subunit SecA
MDNIDPNDCQGPEDLVAVIMPAVEKAYEYKSEVFGEQLHSDIARYLILRTIDENWRDHLLAIDELREGIHLRSYAQMDPLVEYQREATHLFNDVMADINKLIFTHLYKATLVQTSAGGPVDLSFTKEEAPAATAGNGAEESAGPVQPEKPRGVTYRRQLPKVGRNEPCPCGSGKKYKNCCGAAGATPAM